MKKLLALFLTLCMLLSVVSVMAVNVGADGETADATALTPDTAWYDNHKEETDLYIGTAAELLGFSKLISTQLSANNENSDLDTVDASKKIFLGKTVHITADIDLNPGWTAGETAPLNKWLADSYHCFTGMIDGGGHTISGIYLSTTVNHTGIFGNLKGGTEEKPVGVKNLAIVNSYITSNQNCFGGLFGAIPTTEANKNRFALIENVYLDIEQIFTYGAGKWKNDTQTGGVIGYICPGNTVTIRNTVVASSVVTPSENNHNRPVGGFVGLAHGTVVIEDSLFTGVVKSYHNQVAGFVGLVNNGGTATINHCIEAGDIYPNTGTFDLNGHGSIIGISSGSGSSIKNCIYTDIYYAPKGSDVVFVKISNLYGEPNSSDKLTAETNVNNIYVPDDEVYGIGMLDKLTTAGMTDWTVTTTGTPLPRSIVTTFGETILAKADEAETPVTKLAGYQVSDAADNKFDLRLVATLKLADDDKTVTDGKVSNYTSVGFRVVANYGATTKAKDYTTDMVYSAISGYTKGETTVAEYTAESLGGDYLFVLPCRNVPANAGVITMEVTTYYTAADGTVVLGATQVFTVDPAATELH